MMKSVLILILIPLMMMMMIIIITIIIMPITIVINTNIAKSCMIQFFLLFRSQSDFKRKAA